MTEGVQTTNESFAIDHGVFATYAALKGRARRIVIVAGVEV